MVLGLYRAVLVGNWWYWVIKGQCWAVVGFILESCIVVKFVVFCCEIFSFSVGRFVDFSLYLFGTVLLLVDLCSMPFVCCAFGNVYFFSLSFNPICTFNMHILPLFPTNKHSDNQSTFAPYHCFASNQNL